MCYKTRCYRWGNRCSRQDNGDKARSRPWAKNTQVHGTGPAGHLTQSESMWISHHSMGQEFRCCRSRHLSFSVHAQESHCKTPDLHVEKKHVPVWFTCHILKSSFLCQQYPTGLVYVHLHRQRTTAVIARKCRQIASRGQGLGVSSF